jgi:hypothetical protein
MDELGAEVCLYDVQIESEMMVLRNSRYSDKRAELMFIQQLGWSSL